MNRISQFTRLARMSSRLVACFRLGCTLIVVAACGLQAQSTGSVAGVVTDEGGLFLQGASVRVSGSTASATTDRLGRFRIDGVPAGALTVTADYLGHETVTTGASVPSGGSAEVALVLRGSTVILEEFKVESIREGQSRAINQQRSANTLKNIISADAIGNLPDRTIGEALGRLPGVNVVDDSYASIRGTAAQHNSVTLDGDRFTVSGNSSDGTAVQDDTRAVDLSLIPAEMVGGIEVIKVLTADMDADSFGGTINLVTRNAFELKERSINGKFEYIANDYRNKDGWAGSLTYMDVLNEARTFGVSATLTYRQEDRLSDSYEFSYYDPTLIPVGTSGSGTSGAIAAVGDEGMEAYDVRLNYETLTKLGGTLNFDWKFSDTTDLQWRTFYQKTEREGGRFRTRVRALSRWDATSTATLQSGRQVRLNNLLEDGTRDQDVLRLGLGGETRLTHGLLKYGVNYGDSSFTSSRDRYIFDFASNTERRNYTWAIDRSNRQLPTVSVTRISTGENGLLGPLADRTLTSIRFHEAQDDERDLTGNVDYSFTQMLGSHPIDWKVGAKYRTKDRSARPTVRDYTPVGTVRYSSFTVVAEPTDLLRGSMPTMGPYVSLPEVIGLYRTNPASFNAANGGDEIVRAEAKKYDVGEDVTAGYAMASTKFGRLEAIAGLRWEQTETSYNWLADPAGASKGARKYDDFYPSLIFNYRLGSNFVVRLSYTNTLSRPNYGDLIPYRVLADTQAESGSGGLDPTDYPETNKVFLGNADLKAQQSANYDLSLEYYLQRSGVLSVAFFRKDLSDVIFRSQWKDPADPFTLYFQERNGSSGKAQGIEVAWQQALTFLPGPLDGLGINLNATFVDGSSVLEELVPGSAGTYRPLHVDFLPEQPETVYNAQVWWEKYGFTARVAVNYVDEFVRTSGGLTSFSVNNTATRWDVSLSYRLTKNFTLYAEGKNVTNEVTSWYATTPNRPEDYSFNGATYTAGVKFRF